VWLIVISGSSEQSFSNTFLRSMCRLHATVSLRLLNGPASGSASIVASMLTDVATIVVDVSSSIALLLDETMIYRRVW